MLELILRDGTHVQPSAVKIVLPPESEGGEPREFPFAMIASLVLIEPLFDLVHGRMGGPEGMPIKALRFTDSSDLRVEVPMPDEGVRELGRALSLSGIEVAPSVPSGLRPITSPGR